MFFWSVVLTMTAFSNGLAEDKYPGRFFTTPEQRDSIDSIRYASEPEIIPIKLPEPKNSTPEKKSTSKTGPINFKGYVKNQSGDIVYWINNYNSMESSFDDDQFVLRNVKPESGILKLFVDNKKAIELEVGESYAPLEYQDETGPEYKTQSTNTNTR